MELNQDGSLHHRWGRVELGDFCLRASEAARRRAERGGGDTEEVRLFDRLDGLRSAAGASAEGRIYEIPMDPRSILNDPGRAMDFMDRAVEEAMVWGAGLVGLGSMTGVIGRRGADLAERHPIAVTTGNSLTVHATAANLDHFCDLFEIDLTRQVVAVVGIPGSIASAMAELLAPRCLGMVLVGRRRSPQAVELSKKLGASLVLDLPEALAKATIVIAATSSGDCIDPAHLRPGTLVLDVGVPTDVRRDGPPRSDVLVLAAGYSRVPDTVPRNSFFLQFFQGIVPSCLGETMVLSFEGRAESFSIGRELDLRRVREIGRLAEAHGFTFADAIVSGSPMTPEQHSRFLKVITRERTVHAMEGPACGCRESETPACRECEGESIDFTKMAKLAADRFARHINPVLVGVGKLTATLRTFVRGEENELFDESGRAYLDFVAGFGSLNLGHNHPTVVSALTAAIEQQSPGFAPGSINPLAAALAERLVAVAPEGLDMVFFANSGAEAVEASLKLARAATGRAGLLSCEGSYHGKTLGALAVTARRAYQAPFGPMVPGCETVPYGDLPALERALATRQFAAFVVEPVQGEGGMIEPPPGYLVGARELCRASGTLLIADEVQTGLGRTGPLFAVESERVAPDVMTLAKSLGGGLMPIGAMLARRSLWQKAYGSFQGFALHTSTFSGGSLACASGLATLRVLTEPGFLGEAARRGDQLRRGLEAIVRDCPILREVRGRGLMLGVEFQPLPEILLTHFKKNDGGGASWMLVPDHDDLLRNIPSLYVQTILLHVHGIHTQTARSNPRVLRLQPPLTIRPDQLDRFLEAFRSACVEWMEFAGNAEVLLNNSLGELKTEAAH